MKRFTAQGNKWTFQNARIQEFIKSFIENPLNWIDVFGGKTVLVPTNYEPALEFLQKLDGRKLEGIIWDPPYSYHQAKKYDKIAIDQKKWEAYIRECRSIAIKFRPKHWIEAGYNSCIPSKDYEFIDGAVINKGCRMHDIIVSIHRLKVIK